MRFVKLIKLREVIKGICDNYTFDDIDLGRFNKILGKQINDVNSISEITMKHLINEFGDYRLDNKGEMKDENK